MELTDQSPMPYGRAHRGVAMEKVPASYLLWLWDDCNMHSGDTRWMSEPQAAVANYIRQNFHALETECKDRIIKHRP